MNVEENKYKVKRFGLHLIDQKDAVESYLVFTDLVQGNSFLSRIEKKFVMKLGNSLKLAKRDKIQLSCMRVKCVAYVPLGSDLFFVSRSFLPVRDSPR
jgi:hypothetical protein